MKKDLDESLTEKAHHIYSLFYQAQKDTEELSKLAAENTQYKELLLNIPLWSYLYELPFSAHLSLLIIQFDLVELIHDIANSSEPTQNFLDNINKFTNPPNIDQIITDEDKEITLSMVIALFNQFSAISIYGLSLSDLVNKVRDGDKASLFIAVSVDRSAVSTPSIAQRIQVAQEIGDESFMNDLAKAITRTRPRPDENYDDLRYMIKILDEQIGLKNITHNKLYDILSESLELYPKGDTNGSVGNLQKFIRRFLKKSRT